MYKKSVIYITIFILFCIAINWISSTTDNAIMQWYIIDLKSELKEVFLSNDDFNIDGVMLSIYLYDSLDSFTLNGKYYNYFEGSKQYNEIKEKSFNIHMFADKGYFDIKEDYSRENIKLSSLMAMNKAILIRKVMTNIITIAVGIILWYVFKKDIIKKSNDKYREIPVILN